jgi:hypothetical protein
MKAVIDRIEGDRAVVLLGKGEARVDIPLNELPPGCREGTWLVATFEPDPIGEAKQREKIGNLIDKLKNKQKG